MTDDIVHAPHNGLSIAPKTYTDADFAEFLKSVFLHERCQTSDGIRSWGVFNDQFARIARDHPQETAGFLENLSQNSSNFMEAFNTLTGGLFRTELELWISLPMQMFEAMVQDPRHKTKFAELAGAGFSLRDEVRTASIAIGLLILEVQKNAQAPNVAAIEASSPRALAAALEAAQNQR